MNADENNKKPDLNEAEATESADLNEAAEIVPAEIVTAEIVHSDQAEPEIPATSEVGTGAETEAGTEAPVLAILVGAGHSQAENWQGGKPIKPLKPKPKLPFLKSTRAMQVLLILATACSAYFFFRYCHFQSQMGMRGAVIARRALWIAFAGVGTLVAIFRVQRQYVPKDVRAVVWVSLLIGLACFLFVFSERWSWAIFAWMVCHLPLAVVMNFAPQPSEDGASFDVNDSLAANGGAVASATLGVWSVLGSLLTGMSIINSLLGIALGLWGLTSRKKTLAAMGILLCMLGIMACMFNLTYLFWEMVTTPDDQLMDAAFDAPTTSQSSIGY